MKWSFHKYQKIYAIEAAQEYYRDYPYIIQENGIKNIETINIGLWNEKKQTNFKFSTAADSRISEEGNEIINVDTIDNILKGEPVTFIKFDIEGAEYEALLGAEETIKKYKKLVLSIYHKRNDLFKLAKVLLSYNKDYKLYVRHNEFCMYETNMYFIDKKELERGILFEK